MKRLLTAAVAAGTIVLALAATAPAGGSTDVFYVSLGTSLAAGEQPTGDFSHGYADQLAAIVRQDVPNLQLVKLGCPGETTDTFLNGSLCRYPAGSQLGQAVAFLRTHRGRTDFVTIDIGSNDIVEACVDFETGLVDRSCVEATLPAVEANMTTIIQALRSAAPGVPIYGMSYYNPFLAFWLVGPQGPPGDPALARVDERAWEAFNAGLVSTYEANRVRVADVAGAFAISDFGDPVRVKGVVLPLNVFNVCRWTWNCTPPPLGPDIHPNTEGYGVIAQAFANVVRG